MRTNWAWASLLVVGACVETGELTERGTSRIVGEQNGVPFFIEGDLGQSETGRAMLAPGSVDRGVLRSVSDRISPVFRLRADRGERLAFQRSRVDSRGNTHLRFRQTQRLGTSELRVVGGELIAHVDASGKVYAANGSARGPDVVASDKVLSENQARQVVNATGLVASDVALVFWAPEAAQGVKREMRLAFEVRARGTRDAMPADDLVYVDAAEGTVLARHPRIHAVLKRRVYTAGQGTDLPGDLERSEGQAATGDEHIDGNYDRLGEAYECFKQVFGRDSYDDDGAILKSTVHYDQDLANAYWMDDEQQLVFGDGDGTEQGLQGVDFDTAVHEMTHAVTGAESQLVYEDQSGGLNESMSDVMAAVCTSWAADWSTGKKVFQFSEDAFLSGDEALRYLDDPAEDGESLDDVDDYGSSTDVHYSSGIPNLVFALLAKGGKHPREKTNVRVSKIGPEQAGRIFYAANAQYFTADTTFAQARTYMEEAARGLGFDVQAVTDAWAAVGLDPPLRPDAPIALENGQTKTLSSTQEKSAKLFTIEVPPNATSLVFETRAGQGDVDLYVVRGAPPTVADDGEVSGYDCKSDGQTTAELVEVGNGDCDGVQVAAGTWTVLVHGWAPYSGVRLVVRYEVGEPEPEPSATPLQNGQTKTLSSTQEKSAKLFSIEVPEGATSLVFETRAGEGDIDLYIRRGAAPVLGADGEPTGHECASDGGTSAERVEVGAGDCSGAELRAGTWYVMVRGWSPYRGVKLTVTYESDGEEPEPDPDPEPEQPEPQTETLTGSLENEDAVFRTDRAVSENTTFTAELSGSGDADLYVRWGSAPTATRYDCRPFLETSDEVCSWTVPDGVTVAHVLLRGGSGGASEYELRLTYSPPAAH